MHQLFRAMIADIVDARRNAACLFVPAAGNTVDQLRYDADRVLDICEVAAHPAVIEKPDRGSFNDSPCEQKDRHIGPSPRSVDRKEPQTRDRQTIKMAIGISHQL